MILVSSVPWSTWLLKSLQLPDTIVTKQIADRPWYQVLIDIEQAIIPLVLIALLVAIAMGVFKLKKGINEATRLLRESGSDISGAAHSVRNVAEDMRSITSSVRGDVKEVGVTVRAVNDGLRAAAAQAERRLRQLDALVEVAQEEAEDFVVSAASTLRGIREGGSVLRRSFLFARRNGLFKARRRRRWREREDFARDREDDERPRIHHRVPDET